MRGKLPHGVYVAPDLEAFEALNIPHAGIPRKQLTRPQRDERDAAYRALTPEQKALYDSTSGQIAGLRLAASRPVRATITAYLDPEDEPVWAAKAEELGLGEGLSRRGKRRLWRRLADNAMRAIAESSSDRAAVAEALDDDTLLLAHLEAERALWLSRAERDRKLAAAHADAAAHAETALVAQMRKMGLSS